MGRAHATFHSPDRNHRSPSTRAAPLFAGRLLLAVPLCCHSSDLSCGARHALQVPPPVPMPSVYDTRHHMPRVQSCLVCDAPSGVPTPTRTDTPPGMEDCAPSTTYPSVSSREIVVDVQDSRSTSTHERSASQRNAACFTSSDVCCDTTWYEHRSDRA